jgi:all-trans-retinol 13,14-reductase
MHLYFPDETEAIDRYLEQVREAIGGARTFFAEKALPRAAALVAGPWMRRRFLRHSERTLGEVLDEVSRPVRRSRAAAV